MIKLKCPEDSAEMVFDYTVKKYVCQKCGLSLTRTEVENQWDEIRYGKEEPEDKKRRERQEYKDWYFKKKK